MIIVTFKGAPSPISKNTKTVVVVSDTAGPSPALALHSAMRRFKNEKDGFLFVAPGAKIHIDRTGPVLSRRDFDWGAFVDRIGSVPVNPRKFDGVGRVSTETLFVKPTDAAARVLDRWIDRNAASPGRDSINLAITLAELKDVQFLRLPGVWAWREGAMRGLDLQAEPVVEHDVGGARPGLISMAKEKEIPKKETPPPKETLEPVRGPEVLWAGHLRDYSGFAKCNREILYRVSNSVRVQLDKTHQELTSIDTYTGAKLDALETTLVGQKAPFVRFFGPDFNPPKGRHRISFTMMETLKIHPQMVGFVNDRFDELWVPTEAGRRAFVESGVRVESRVVPLGVDAEIYRPWKRRKLPECRLISTGKAGLRASPQGFIFITVGLPSFRKNFSFLADAFERVFSRRPDVHLVLGLTHSLADWKFKIYRQFAKYKSRIWTLEGKFSEYELARIYSSCDAYATANLGEGYNLPMVEAAACGIPVIAPAHTSHPDVAGDAAWLFKSEGEAVHPEAETVSPWYQGVPFPVLGKVSAAHLEEMLLHVRIGGSGVKDRAKKFREKIEAGMTWDHAAAQVVRRLLEVQP
jgi:hypothetical protein